MNIAQLKTFLSIVERGSFSEAARTLGISQPAVTMQIQGLESDLGVTLLDRRYRRVELTEAGQALLPYAKRVLAELDHAREDITALSGTVSGTLRIAASTTPGVYLVPRVLAGFLACYPEVRVVITVHDTGEVVSAVESGAADVGIAGSRVKGARAVFEELGSDELVTICPPSSPLAGRRNVPVTDLTEVDWVSREPGSGTRAVREKALAELGVDPNELRTVVELGTGEAIVSAVEGGLGVAMMSRLVAEKALALGTVAEIELAGAPIRRPFFIVLPKGTHTRAAEAFARHLRDSLAG